MTVSLLRQFGHSWLAREPDDKAEGKAVEYLPRWEKCTWSLGICFRQHVQTPNHTHPTTPAQSTSDTFIMQASHVNIQMQTGDT